eukprot:CAMPEP_0198488678 /NCGR_PEP_ID=MMETSP1462-20131121/929_1 /TAXON_ID=1333877 /ORGANISM="Brandtodinium nutriculum, Strain RCC3387" /LENGTH=42 /DNA_ID= /DNA_START= /DNA_END= /DNA_ORIENTATION=
MAMGDCSCVAGLMKGTRRGTKAGKEFRVLVTGATGNVGSQVA